MTSDTTYSSSAPPARRSGSFVPIILLTVIAVAAGAAAMWFVTVYKMRKDSEEQTRTRFVQMSGLDRPSGTKLSAEFVDADTDLVPDPPKDAAKLVDPASLVFCYVAAEEGDEYEKQWKPFCDHLSKVTGKSVEYRQYKSSDEQLKALREGQLHVTGFNTGSVPIAVNACGFVPVARVPTGEPSGTHVEIIVPADSPIKDINDLRDKKYKLALTEPNSNSGYKAPLVLLHADKGLSPERDYLLVFTGSHMASVEGIAGKRLDAAAVSADILAREVARGVIGKANYRTIFTSEPFPSAALGFAHNLKPELAGKVREAITSFDMKGTPLEQEFTPANQTTFVPVNYKNDWSVIRRIDEASMK